MSEEVLQQSGVPTTKDTVTQESTTTDKGTETATKAKPYESKVFAALAKREREQLNIKQQIKAERETLDKDRKEYEEWKFAKEQAKKNPKSYLEKANLSYEDVTQFYLNDEKPTVDSEVSSLKQELENFKQEQIAEKKRLQEEEITSQQKQVESTISEFKTSIKSMVEKETDKYELINLFEQSDMVYDTIAEHFNQELQKQKEDETYKPTVLTKEQAADLVEEYLEKEQFSRMEKSKKFKSKFNIADVKKEDAKVKTDSWGTKTLNNDEALSSAPSLLSTKTENDRIKRAMAALGV